MTQRGIVERVEVGEQQVKCLRLTAFNPEGSSRSLHAEDSPVVPRSA